MFQFKETTPLPFISATRLLAQTALEYAITTSS
jgi:hypothetical protein